MRAWEGEEKYYPLQVLGPFVAEFKKLKTASSDFPSKRQLPRREPRERKERGEEQGWA